MIRKYFLGSFVFTAVGLGVGAYVGYIYGGTQAILSTLFILAVLSVLEISLSFDNAVVNATVLKNMTELWKRRFLTWGILIAVFGMRLVFPLLIVGVLAQLNPIEALRLAAFEPARYAEIMLSSHVMISAYGGAFLMMVCLKFLFDPDKTTHWFAAVERHLARLGRLPSIELGLVLSILLLLSRFLPEASRSEFVIAGVAGLITYIIVDVLSALLSETGAEDTIAAKAVDPHRASIGMFLYLEVLDASFSFDGVVGAFAITHNLFIITIGLGIGAMFVRSLTILMVERETLSEFKYLEHGAFWAIGLLATLMFLNPIFHIPEVVTGLSGLVIIGFAFYHSLNVRRAIAA
jgi:hypothetical protein